MYNVCVEKLYIKSYTLERRFPMYFPTSSALIEFLILAVLEQDDSYGYEISQTIKLIANIKESTLYPILKKIGRQ